MKIFHFLFSLILLSSCSIFEDEVFRNTDSKAMLEDDIINEKKSPPFSFFRALQSVERDEIELELWSLSLQLQLLVMLFLQGKMESMF